MVRDGIIYAIILALLGLLAARFSGWPWAAPLWVLAAFMLYFFRDPERAIPPGEGVVSPADGRIVEVRQVEREGQAFWKISIFLSLFDVHVNRAPIAGTIRNIAYQRGRFLIASRPEASLQNEQNTVTIEGERSTVTFKQIAGLVARRIVFWKKRGERVERGERVGLIRFGSRVDLLLPLELAPSVRVGEHVKAGSSILAQAIAAPRDSAVLETVPARPKAEH
ncbi:MAG: phosphatidylserine decarboxylase family protein [Acidobacteria bacterium]|nr:phosphatidylserine decarboxylase family protein [Acidobacteriota bacterium]